MSEPSKLSSGNLPTQPLKGMIDFPPTVLDEYEAVHQIIHQVAHQFRYREYDLPILESWDTFAVKSATEILEEQSYHFEDRGGRKILLRPEITPALARLVAKEIKQLPQPVRWYIIGRCFRYERPQKGRFREFRQLNFDILGKKNYLYDLEILRVVKELMHAFGVSSKQYVIRYNHRGVVNTWLKQQGFSPAESKQFFTIADRKNKLSSEEFDVFIKDNFNTLTKQQTIETYFACTDLSDLLPDKDTDETDETKEVRQFLVMLKNLTPMFNEVLVFDPEVVRGFDYYTGLVFEVFSKDGEIRRSLFGGGRYDNLIGNYLSKGQEQISGIGFGMGIDIFILFLKSIGKTLTRTTSTPGIYIAPLAPLDETGLAYSITVGEKLLAHGYQIEIAPVLKLAKHFNRLTALGASTATGQPFSVMILIGADEAENNTCTLKNLVSGEQKTVPLKELSILEQVQKFF